MLVFSGITRNIWEMNPSHLLSTQPILQPQLLSRPISLLESKLTQVSQPLRSSESLELLLIPSFDPCHASFALCSSGTSSETFREHLSPSCPSPSAPPLGPPSSGLYFATSGALSELPNWFSHLKVSPVVNHLECLRRLGFLKYK